MTSMDKKQAKAVQFCLDNPVSYIQLDMGAGKTKVSLLTICELLDQNKIRRVLVVAPKNVALISWPSEIDKYPETRHLTYSVMLGTPQQRRKAYQAENQVDIINYENLIWLVNEFRQDKRVPYQMVVFDEITFMKGFKSKRVKEWKKVTPYIKRSVGLSGTPVPNDYLDWWGQLCALDGGATLGKSFYKDYRERYFYLPNKWREHDWHLLPGAKTKIDKLLHKICYTDEHDFGVACYIEDVWVELPPDIMKKYKTLENKLFLELDGEKKLTLRNMADRFNKLLQFTGGFVYHSEEDSTERTTERIHSEKIKAYKELIKKKVLENNHLLVYNYIEEKNQLSPFGRALRSKDSEKTEDIAQWNDGKVKCLMVHPRNVGHGLNLQHGGHVAVWYSLTCSLENYLQTNKRKLPKNALT